MVPAPLQAGVWATYRPGQEVDKKPTRAYLDAADAAIAAVAAKEAAKTPQPSDQLRLFNAESS
jgi:hypothetical protein